MKKTTLLFIIIFCFSSLMQSQIISQYIETNSGAAPRGIEIWNNTISILDFSKNNLIIKVGIDGASPSSDFTLSSGTLALDAVLVIGTSSLQATTEANGTIFHLKAFTFDGNDALEVWYGATKTDVFGTPGLDPGKAWSGKAGVSSANQNIQLSSRINTGTLTGFTDPSDRFEVVSIDPVDNDTGFGIGSITATTWTGATNTDWNIAGNWSSEIPSNSSAVNIPNVLNKPIISATSNIFANSISIDTFSSLTISSGGNLTIINSLTNNGTLSIISDTSNNGSLIVNGSSTGNILYNRFLTGVDKWHLVTAPVGMQSINAFVFGGRDEFIVKSGVKYGLAPYNNNGTLGLNMWSNWTTDSSNPLSNAGDFIAGKGYEILTTSDGTVTFTGTISVSQVSIALTKGTTNRWNLVGNPFPSSIPANSNADVDNNFLTENIAALDASFQALYFWNPETANYDIINQTSAATFIAPGQAFFVNSVTGGAVVNFTTAMRLHQSAATFQRIKTISSPKITLIANNNTTGKKSTTSIKYINGTSLGLDPGFDAGYFSGIRNSFILYSKLVVDNGEIFSLQVVPDNNYDTTVIPIGLDADAGTKITFKAQITNLPVGKKIFLEDSLLGNFTELNSTDKTYTLTLSTQSQGVGRFFLHTLDSLSTLSTPDINILNISIIARPKENNIRVIGNSERNSSFEIYNTLGQSIFKTELKTKSNYIVYTPQMAKGIYFVKIQSTKGNYSTKIAWY